MDNLQGTMTTGQWTYANQDVCECSEKCEKCGKRKNLYPTPLYPYYTPNPWHPYCPYPTQPWISWTITST
jgi:hypothetical protein